MGRTKATTQVSEEKVEEQPVVKSTKTASLPHYVDEVLKMHPDLEQVYVSKYGGAFTPETPEIIRGKAQLYINPYFNK